MGQDTTIQNRKPLRHGEQAPYRWRNTPVGMWAWIWQRLSALAIIFFLALHLTLTYKPIIQFLLLLTVTFHAVLGLRVIFLDFNIVNVKYQKALIAGLAGTGLLILVIIWTAIY
ncbi:MAG: succinate dehydrogenase [Deltaproteobacteria bacterium]|nr:succinate dehydrogenase [Deltaproteobacteria bacterium]MBW1996116.1 succinate dehydrogenase [Deltaproteobacteria bacterium]